MPVVFLIAAAAVLVGVFFAATGRGGELSAETADHAPLDLGPVSAADIALLRPPTSLWGYNMQVTDEALDHIARAMRDRDVTIARLRQQLVNRDLMEPVARPAGAPPTRAEARRPLEVPGDLTAPQPVVVSADPSAPPPAAGPGESEDTQRLSFLKPPGVLVASRSPEPTPPREATQPSEITPPGAVTPPSEPASSAEVTQPNEVVQPRGASPSSEITQPGEAIRPPEATRPPAATQPTEAMPPPLPAPHDIQGPQGWYDTHDRWAGQEQAAHQEAPRQAGAQPATSAPAAGAPGAGSPRPATPDDPGADALSTTEEQGW